MCHLVMMRYMVMMRYLVMMRYMVMMCYMVMMRYLLLSFVAFILEEVVTSCISCSALYFFEFISCTAFLFTLLLLILLSTKLHRKVGITCWSSLDFYYTAAIAVLFLLASIVFSADNGRTSLEQTAVAFGFLSTLAFVLDVVLFWKNNGFPWKKEGGKPEASNGNATPATHETEKLNTEAGGAE
ncbi:CKLF-like MARVEL transmembrane domain-containing protein 6 [Centroberyx affinis]|uniref:CKLF-like MARVEL transmembrane domain-containing protein 6 n=1 Tax=Centroberyx affinis TaxID=166261 RepID=UPI003A5BBC38